ncbi:MAG: hypothetical protein IJV95_03465 [Clostridia bacterium]|nr:hypothetical protein [Clostridia bacterium]
MADFFNGVIDRIRVNVGTVGVFIILFFVLTVAFIVFLPTCVFKREFTLKKRVAFLPFAVGVIAVQGGAEIIIGGDSLVLILAGLCIFFVGIIFTIPVKRTEYRQEHVEFAKFLDQKAKSVINTNCDRSVDRIKCVEREDKKESAELDYSHVKNILSKMEYYPLSVSDKRQVKDLTVAVNLAESGDNGTEIKNRINDGLGALLKIMSKHGI